MKNNEGRVYTEAYPGTLTVTKQLEVKKLRFGWSVIEKHTGEIVIAGVSSRLKAQYVVAALSGKAVNYFEFGEM